MPPHFYSEVQAIHPVGENRLAARIREGLLWRNEVFESFFEAEAPRLADACCEVTRRFLADGSWCSGTVLQLPDASAGANSCISCSEQVH